MISKMFRFHGYNSLRHVYRHGKSVRGQWCALRYALNDRRTQHRIAVVVSRKVSKKAVVRNRIRRRIYEVMRQYEPNISQPFDIVITVYSEQPAELNYEDVQQTVDRLLKQAHII